MENSFYKPNVSCELKIALEQTEKYLKGKASKESLVAVINIALRKLRQLEHDLNPTDEETARTETQIKQDQETERSSVRAKTTMLKSRRSTTKQTQISPLYKLEPSKLLEKPSQEQNSMRH